MISKMISDDLLFMLILRYPEGRGNREPSGISLSILCIIAGASYVFREARFTWVAPLMMIQTPPWAEPPI
jgi:hypothetical protein